MENRIPIERDVTRLKVVHRQRVLRLGASDPAPAFSKESMDPELVRAAATGWTRLLETEYESVVIAGWMASALTRLGAPLDVIGAFGRVVEDEIRHVDVCAQMIEMFGEKPSVPRGERPPFPMQTNDPDVELEVIGGLVGFFCVFEHLSAHVFRQALEAAESEIAQWALSEIHRDEAFHGAFGFETAKVFVPRWSDAQRKKLATKVTDEIRRFETRLGGPLTGAAKKPEGGLTRALEKLGLLAPEALLSTFYTSVETELLPRMQELGVPVELRVEQRQRLR